MCGLQTHIVFIGFIGFIDVFCLTFEVLQSVRIVLVQNNKKIKSTYFFRCFYKTFTEHINTHSLFTTEFHFDLILVT
jgi:hypothetical protein